MLYIKLNGKNLDKLRDNLAIVKSNEAEYLFGSEDLLNVNNTKVGRVLIVEKSNIKNPDRNTNEKINSEFPYPPSLRTSAPTKNTAAAVKNLPILKQNPVEAALTDTGKSNGM